MSSYCTTRKFINFNGFNGFTSKLNKNNEVLKQTHQVIKTHGLVFVLKMFYCY